MFNSPCPGPQAPRLWGLRQCNKTGVDRWILMAQGNGKWEEIPTKMRTSGLFRYQSSCFSFSIGKWATGIRFSLLDLLITWVWNGPYHPDQHPGCQLRCAKSSSSTALLFVPKDPGFFLFTIFLPKMFFKKGNFMRIARKKMVLKLYELSLWSVTSSGQGISPAKGKDVWPLVGNENYNQDAGPRSLQVLQLKIPITARPEKSKDFDRST